MESALYDFTWMHWSEFQQSCSILATISRPSSAVALQKAHYNDVNMRLPGHGLVWQGYASGPGIAITSETDVAGNKHSVLLMLSGLPVAMLHLGVTPFPSYVPALSEGV